MYKSRAMFLANTPVNAKAHLLGFFIYEISKPLVSITKGSPRFNINLIL